MFVRLRWFTLGAVSSLGAVAFLAAKVKRARQRLSPAALAARGRASLAGLFDRAADRIAPEPGDLR